MVGGAFCRYKREDEAAFQVRRKKTFEREGWIDEFLYDPSYFPKEFSKGNDPAISAVIGSPFESSTPHPKQPSIGKGTSNSQQAIRKHIRFEADALNLCFSDGDLCDEDENDDIFVNETNETTTNRYPETVNGYCTSCEDLKVFYRGKCSKCAVNYDAVVNDTGHPDIERIRYQPNRKIPRALAKLKTDADAIELAKHFPDFDVMGNRLAGFQFDVTSHHSIVRGCGYAQSMVKHDFGGRIEKINTGAQVSQGTSYNQLQLCLWTFFKDLHANRNPALDEVFSLPGSWFTLACAGPDYLEEGYMACVWKNGSRLGVPGIYIPMGIILGLV